MKIKIGKYALLHITCSDTYVHDCTHATLDHIITRVLKLLIYTYTTWLAWEERLVAVLFDWNLHTNTFCVLH